MANEKKAIVGVEKKEEHPETHLANQISIMDFAKKNNLVISYEDEKIAKIQDVVTEEEITVFKENNTWSVRENGTLTGGRTVRFAARMLEMQIPSAIDTLVENRGKYKGSTEYNLEYAKQHNQVEETNEKKLEADSIKKGVVAPSKSTDKVEIENEESAIAASKDGVPMPIHYSKLQIAEILAGTKRGLDIKVFDKIELKPEQMRELRLALEKDINLSKFAYKQVSEHYLKEVRLAAQDGLDIKVFNLKKKECIYSAEQAREIRLGLKNGLNSEQMKVYLKRELQPDVMRELRIGLQDGLNVMSDFNSGLFTAKDIHTVRMHLIVKQLLESIKQKMAMLFEQVREAIGNNLRKQKPDMSAQEIMEETDWQIKDTVKVLYEAIEESISEKNIEDKKEILAGVFQKVVAMGNAIEEIYPDKEKAEAFQEAASNVEEKLQQNTMKSRALEALKTDYAEKFAESEQQHNVQIVELTEKLMNEPRLSAEQKKEVLLDSLNFEMSESAIDSFMEHLPQPATSDYMMQYQQEITEYFEEFEIEQ